MRVEIVLIAALGCGSAQRDTSLERLRDATAQTERDVELDGTLSTYVHRGVARHPALRAQLERWRAASHRVDGARRWPRPTIGYTAYVRPVETRVGPQRQRVSVRVPLAWPSQLRSGPRAAAAMSSAEGHRFTAQVLALQQRVADVYWTRWLIDRKRAVLVEQATLLDGIAEVVRGRMAVGASTLAQLQSIEVRRARLRDAVDALDEAAARTDATLRAEVGLDDEDVVVSEQPPDLVEPSEPIEALRVAALQRPELAMQQDMAEAAEARADRARAARLPNVVLGLDWIETAEARMPNVSGSGDDALMLGVMVGIPLDAARDRRRAEAEEAEARAHLLDSEARALEIRREVDVTLSDLRDALRRARLHESTLSPQASAAYQALLGEYATGRTSIAMVLQGQRDLLEIQLALEESRAAYARAWARLERAVGRPLRALGSTP